MASGANSTFRQVGIATGIAGLGSIFQTQIQHRTIAALGSTPAGQSVVAHGGAALQSAILGGAVHQVAAAIPSAAARQALVQAAGRGAVHMVYTRRPCARASSPPCCAQTIPPPPARVR